MLLSIKITLPILLRWIIVLPGWRVSNVGRLMGGQVHTAQTPKSLAPPENIPNILSLSLWNIVRLAPPSKGSPSLSDPKHSPGNGHWTLSVCILGLFSGNSNWFRWAQPLNILRWSPKGQLHLTIYSKSSTWIFSDGAQKGKLQLTIFKKLHLQGYSVYHLSVTLLVQLLHLSVPAIGHWNLSLHFCFKH